METVRYELRHAARALRRRPALTIVAVLTLALGIGGATAIFSVADAVVLKPLPYADPDRLVVAWQSDRTRNQPFVEISYPAFREWRDRTHLFEAIAAMPSVNDELALTGRGEPITVEGRGVTGAFFRLFGVAPAVGRVLLPEDEQPGAAAVVVLSHGLWRDRFSSDPEVVGRSMVLDGRPRTIVGVMPAAFTYPKGARLWIPLQPSADGGWMENAGVMWMIAIGRLKAGVRIEAAQGELSDLWRQMHRRFAPEGADTSMLDAHTVIVTPLPEAIFGSTRPALLAIFGAGIFVLLMACANVAGLLLVQATGRRQEMAVRHALGASRSRLARSAFAESLLIAWLGGVGGLAAAWLATPVVIALSPADVPRLHEASVNTRVLAFATRRSDSCRNPVGARPDGAGTPNLARAHAAPGDAARRIRRRTASRRPRGRRDGDRRRPSDRRGVIGAQLHQPAAGAAGLQPGAGSDRDRLADRTTIRRPRASARLLSRTVGPRAHDPRGHLRGRDHAAPVVEHGRLRLDLHD